MTGIYSLVITGALVFSGCGLNPGDEIIEHSDQNALVYVQEPIYGSNGNKNSMSVMRSNVDEFRPGTDIMLLSPVSPGGNKTNLTTTFHGGVGAACDPEVNSDGSKILFSMRMGDRYSQWKIYEMNSDGTELLQITEPESGDDFDPAYLPNGDIVFVSTRSGIVDEYERRASPLLHVGKRNSDGVVVNDSVRQISFNQSHDANPMVHSSGKIYFSRWEHLGNPNKFVLFSINPDGTGLFFLAGAHKPSGDGSRTILEAREMRDKGLLISVMTRNSPFEGGAVGVLDLSDLNASPDFISDDGVLWDNNNGEQFSKGLFKTPHPILDGNEEKIIVSVSPYEIAGNNGSEKVDYGLYIMDKSGNQTRLILNTDTYHELAPIPLNREGLPVGEVRTVDPWVQAGLDSGKTTGFFFNQNAYLRGGEGDQEMTITKDTLMPDGVMGQARHYRVLQAVGLPRDRALRGGDIGNTNLEKKKVIGYAPIREDGSTSMEVPANTSLHLQSVDFRGLALVQQRTWVQVMPGEKRLCTGCHAPHELDPHIFNLAIDPVTLTVNDTVNNVTYASGFHNTADVRTYSPNGISAAPVLSDTLDFYSVRNDFTVTNVFNRTCASCHSATVASGGLNLTHTAQSDSAQMDNYTPLYNALTEENNYYRMGRKDSVSYVSERARTSPLMWLLFNEQLNDDSNPDYVVRTDTISTNYNHATFWRKNDQGLIDVFHEENRDLLTLIEWIDMGTQFSNSVGYAEEELWGTSAP
ncbi:MAG: hypothetical protein OCD76_09015 [Reichenbachiella sp.]